MRIGFDCTPIMPMRSGVGHYTEQLLHHLLQVRPEWEFLLYSNRVLNGETARLAGARPVDGHFRPSRWLWMQARLPRVIRHSQPDLCHFPNNSAPLVHVRPYVVTIHDASLFLYSRFHPRSRLLALRLLLPRVARRAAAVITVTQHARRDLVRVLGLAPEKVHVIGEAASAHFRPASPEERQRLQRKYRLPPRFVFYAGTLEPRKNLGRLIQALGKLQEQGLEPHLILAGPNGWLGNSRLEEAIQEAGLAGRVRYLGYVPEEDLPGLYSLATLFAFPSLYEGFGLPPLEAMACGAPTLTSRGSAMAEVCGEAALLVDPRDVDEMAQGLARLWTDASLRAELRERGFRQARKYSWEQTARETAALYERVSACQ